MELGELIDKHGSDKKVSGYDYFYAKIFEKIRYNNYLYLYYIRHLCSYANPIFNTCFYKKVFSLFTFLV